MNSTQLAGTCQRSMITMFDKPPPALKPPAKQHTGPWQCQDYHPGKWIIYSAALYYQEYHPGKWIIYTAAFYYVPNQHEHL